MEIKQVCTANMADQPETWESPQYMVQPGKAKEEFQLADSPGWPWQGELFWPFLTFAICSGLRRLDRSHREWLLFELNIYSSEMGDKGINKQRGRS